MSPDLEVDTQALQACVRPLLELSATVRAAHPPATLSTPRWATSDAAGALATATGVRGGLLATDLAGAADRLAAVVRDYDEADEQIAGRLRAVR
ncbi:hypothetical protein AB0M54_26040 [Actinoplanes sp. NPDC051470]|uniref:hypothetical protein n=1 Tax=Actinoplanes sp. NPDC051470 TaxID=3157224 RepID=UPI003431F475